MKTNKKQDIEDVQPVQEPTTKKEVKLYDYAHLVVFCGKCGHKQILEENVSKDRGIQINLPPTSAAEMILVCKECNNRMGLFYVESNKKDIKSEETNESVQEGSPVTTKLI
jgi:hypothetical protein